MRKRLQKSFENVTDLTKQHFKEETDINNIMAKYEANGTITHINSHPAQFGDFSNVNDLQDAMHKVWAAQAQFDALPSELRLQFNNSPVEFYEKLTTATHDDLREYGLIVDEKQSENTETAKSENANDQSSEQPSDHPPLDVNGRTDTKPQI
jgi:hypothetical protein